MSFNAENLRAKLAGANETQDGISSIAQYVLFHKRHASAAAQVWAQSLSDAPVNQKLALIYVLNEVVQQAKIRKKEEFVTAFAEVICAALPKAFAEVPPATQKRISRVVGVWRDRSVFPFPVLSQLEGRLSAANSVPEISQPAVADSFFSTTTAKPAQSKPSADLTFAPKEIKTFFNSWAKLESQKQKYESLVTPLVSKSGYEPSSAQSLELAQCLEVFTTELEEMRNTVSLLQNMTAQPAKPAETDLVSPEFEPLTPEQQSDTELALADELGSDAEEEEEEYVPGGRKVAAESPEEEEYVPQPSKKQKVELSNDVADFLASLTKK